MRAYVCLSVMITVSGGAYMNVRVWAPVPPTQPGPRQRVCVSVCVCVCPEHSLAHLCACVCVLVVVLWCSMIAPEDRAEYLEGVFGSWGHAATPSSHFIKVHTHTHTLVHPHTHTTTCP
jgi:hypothetical protein